MKRELLIYLYPQKLFSVYLRTTFSPLSTELTRSFHLSVIFSRDIRRSRLNVQWLSRFSISPFSRKRLRHLVYIPTLDLETVFQLSAGKQLSLLIIFWRISMHWLTCASVRQKHLRKWSHVGNSGLLDARSLIIDIEITYYMYDFIRFVYCNCLNIFRADNPDSPRRTSSLHGFQR